MKRLYTLICIISAVLQANSSDLNEAENKGTNQSDAEQASIDFVGYTAYDAPTLITWFDETTNISMKNGCKLSTTVYEATNMYNPEEIEYNYYFSAFFGYYIGKSSISISLTPNEVKSIIFALNRIHKFTTESVYTHNKNISYQPDIKSPIDIRFDFEYKDQKWLGCISLTTDLSETSTQPEHGVHGGGFSLHGYFKDVINDLPKFIKTLEKGFSSIEARMNSTNNKPGLVMTPVDETIHCYFANNVSSSDIKVVELDAFYQLYDTTFDINKKLNDIISDEIKTFNYNDKYGTAVIIVNPSGEIINREIIFAKDAADSLNKRTIILLLNKLNKLELKPEKSKLKYTHDYFKIEFPLYFK